MSEFEKSYLKTAICEMIDNDMFNGIIDTMSVNESTHEVYNGFIRKRFEFSIKEIMEWYS